MMMCLWAGCRNADDIDGCLLPTVHIMGRLVCPCLWLDPSLLTVTVSGLLGSDHLMIV